MLLYYQLTPIDKLKLSCFLEKDPNDYELRLEDVYKCMVTVNFSDNKRLPGKLKR
jgi:hypothetical protein